MAWILTNLIPVTIVTLLVALCLLAAAQYVSNRWPSHPLNTVLGPVAASIVIAAVVGPTFTHMWAMKRDLEQRQWNARVAHFERIRPILHGDANHFLDYSRRVTEQGHLLGALDQSAEIVRNEEQMWNPDLLVADLQSHFPEYGAARAQLRKDSAAHDRRLRELVQRIGTTFSVRSDVGNDDRSVRLNAGIALVHRCSRGGYGMLFEINKDGGHSFSYSSGGGGSGGPPSPAVVATWNAFRGFRPDASFTAECAKLKSGADELAGRLSKLASDDANALAELATLNGKCEYLR